MYTKQYTQLAEEYTFPSSILGTFSRTVHILGHRMSLNKFKNKKIIQSIFPGHSGMKWDMI